MTNITSTTFGGEAISVISRSPRRQAVRRFLKHKMAVVSACIIIFFIFLAICGPLISSHKYDEQNLEVTFQPPSGKYLCGTDSLGRDLLVRIMEGSRISFVVGFAAALVSLVIGL